METHGYKIAWARPKDGGPRVIELWDGPVRVCGIANADDPDRPELIFDDLYEMANAANESDDCNELRERISDLEDELRDRCEDCDTVCELKSDKEDLEKKVGELEGQVDELKSKIEELEG